MINKIFKLRGTSYDAMLLTFAKVVTAILGLLITKLLSTHLSLQEYGTYSQALLIVSTASSMCILGLADATNYFYNSADSEDEKRRNVSTIFGIQYIIGALAAITILLLTVPIIKYFDNRQLKSVIIFAAWMPMLQNLISMLQALFVSVGKAKLIAIRNFAVSVSRLIIVSISCFLTDSIVTIFLLLLILDILQAGYFLILFSKLKFSITLRYFDWSRILSLLKFSVPMAVYILTNTLSKDIDKYVIGLLTNTETLAIYTNAAKQLPLDMPTMALLTVLVPIITRQIRSEEYISAQTTFRVYLRTGYLCTWIIAAGLVVVSKELIVFLYDDKYLPGLSIFIIYLFVDMIRFANVSLVLSAKGKTAQLMLCSLTMLPMNLIFNVVSFRLFGIIGPALSTLVITFGVTIVLLNMSAHVIRTSIHELFNWKELFRVTTELLCVCVVSYILKGFLCQLFASTTILMILTYGFYLIVVLLLNRAKILDSIKNLNGLK